MIEKMMNGIQGVPEAVEFNKDNKENGRKNGLHFLHYNPSESRISAKICQRNNHEKAFSVQFP
jgi:hypothetical protein